MSLPDDVAKVLIIGAGCALLGVPAFMYRITEKLGYVTQIADDICQDVARACALVVIMGDNWDSRSAETPVVFICYRLAPRSEIPHVRGMCMDLTLKC